MRAANIDYSQAELTFVSNNRTLPISELYQAFNEKFNHPEVSAQSLHGLRKRNGWKTGRTGQFKKGNIPHPNAGTKGPNKTSFKKGSKPANYLPVGYERTSSEGYLEIKIAEGKNQWRLKQRLTWEKQNGDLLPTEVIRFKDGNKQNCHISNLEKFNRLEHLFLNKVNHDNLPDEIKPTARVYARLAAKTSQLANAKEQTQ